MPPSLRLRNYADIDNKSAIVLTHALAISRRKQTDGNVGLWHEAVDCKCPLDSRFQGQSGLDLLTSNLSGRDPNVWSGRALQEVFVDPEMRSCINVSGLWLERVVLRAIMDISAHSS